MYSSQASRSQPHMETPPPESRGSVPKLVVPVASLGSKRATTLCKRLVKDAMMSTYDHMLRAASQWQLVGDLRIGMRLVETTWIVLDVTDSVGVVEYLGAGRAAPYIRRSPVVCLMISGVPGVLARLAQQKASFFNTNAVPNRPYSRLVMQHRIGADDPAQWP